MNLVQKLLQRLHAPTGIVPMTYVHDNEKLVQVDIRELYKGCSCFWIGNGPSFMQIPQELRDKLRSPGLLTWGINNGPKSFRPNIWASVDPPARFMESIWRDPQILKFVSTGKHEMFIWDHDKWDYSQDRAGTCPNVIWYKLKDHFEPGKFFDEPQICFGNNKKYGGGRSVMIASLKIMYLLGIRRLYLLGTDFHMTAEHKYHFEEERHKGAVKHNSIQYGRHISYFTQLMPEFKKRGIEIWNCTEGSSLNLFPIMSLEDALAHELAKLPDPITEKSGGMYVAGKDKK